MDMKIVVAQLLFGTLLLKHSSTLLLLRFLQNSILTKFLKFLNFLLHLKFSQPHIQKKNKILKN